jgi:hypothetical protein
MIARQGHGGKPLCATIHAPPATGKLSAERPLIGIMPVIEDQITALRRHKG